MYTGKKLGDAIKVAIQMKGIKQADVAKEFGIKPPSVTSWIQTGRVDKSHIDKLVAFFSDVVGPEHFGINSAFESNISKTPYVLYQVPLISLSDVKNCTDNNFQLLKKELVSTMYKPKEHTFAVCVQGDMMKPEFLEGEIITVEPDMIPRSGSFVLVCEKGAEATIRQYIIDGRRQYLKILNTQYPNLIEEFNSSMSICGVIVEKYKQYF